MNRCTASGLAIALLTFVPVYGMCQSREAADVHLRNACRLAEQVITTGNPRPHLAWAWRFIPDCGNEVYARVLASEISSQRRATDVASIASLWDRTTRFRDATLFAMLLDVAGDRSASTASRVFAFRSLILLERPDYEVRYSNLIGGWNKEASFPFPMGACMSGHRTGPFVLDGTPLPQNWRAALYRLRARILADAGEPEDIRTAAACS
ncbi:MAG: hypothetical protein JWM27_3962 [Gemmatimonadetes bacterium]|nr:hypothetical protein [Gemmatimonadota bacterium]